MFPLKHIWQRSDTSTCAVVAIESSKNGKLAFALRGIRRSQSDQSRERLPITIHYMRLFHMMLAIPSTNNFESLVQP